MTTAPSSPTLSLRRQPNADRRLVQWARPLAGASVVWGETDCASLALEAIAVQCGVRVEQLHTVLGLDERPYRTRLGALRYQRAVRDAAAGCEALGLTPVQRRQVHTGDLVVRPQPSTVDAVSVIVGDRALGVLHEMGERVGWLARAAVLSDGAVVYRIDGRGGQDG